MVSFSPRSHYMEFCNGKCSTIWMKPRNSTSCLTIPATETMSFTLMWGSRSGLKENKNPSLMIQLQWSDSQGLVKMKILVGKKKKKFNESASVMPDHALSPTALPRLSTPVVPEVRRGLLPVLRLGLNSRLVLGGGKASGAVCAGRVRYGGGVNSSSPEKLLRTPPVMGRLDKLTGFFPTGIFLSKYQVKLK